MDYKRLIVILFAIVLSMQTAYALDNLKEDFNGGSYLFSDTYDREQLEPESLGMCRSKLCDEISYIGHAPQAVIGTNRMHYFGYDKLNRIIKQNGQVMYIPQNRLDTSCVFFNHLKQQLGIVKDRIFFMPQKMVPGTGLMGYNKQPGCTYGDSC